MVNRNGRSSLGCLFTLLVVVAAGYFAVHAGEVYLRYYRFRDSMQQSANFAGRYTDAQLKQRLRLTADSLGLPASAHEVQVRRRGNRVTIWTEYYDRIELPAFSREIHFAPRAESTF